MTQDNESMGMTPVALPETELTAEQMNTVATVVTSVIAPVFQALSEMVSQNAQALERFAALQAQQNARMEQLERQMRLNTPVTSQQTRYINNAIRARAKEILAGKGVDKPAATKKMSNAIRKYVLVRYGVSAVNELPKCEYSVVMDMVNRWLDVHTVREIAKEAAGHGQE